MVVQPGWVAPRFLHFFVRYPFQLRIVVAEKLVSRKIAFTGGKGGGAAYAALSHQLFF
jgi:hypothetical protein